MAVGCGGVWAVVTESSPLASLCLVSKRCRGGRGDYTYTLHSLSFSLIHKTHTLPHAYTPKHKSTLAVSLQFNFTPSSEDVSPAVVHVPKKKTFTEDIRENCDKNTHTAIGSGDNLNTHNRDPETAEEHVLCSSIYCSSPLSITYLVSV